MSVESIMKAMRIKEIIAEQLRVGENEITQESRFVDDLGADSLDLLEVLMALEEEYNLDIPNEDAEKMLTVGDVVAYVQEHTTK